MKKAQYRPSDDEHFMSSRQLEYFKAKIIARKEALLRVLTDGHPEETTEEEQVLAGDLVDQANDLMFTNSKAFHRQHDEETLCSLEKALARIENGTYGYCEVTGNPISLARLDAFPAATMSIEAQEEHEHKSRLTRLHDRAE